MPSLSLKTKFGGGATVPIRGIQEFSSTTPNDYTTPSGERFLRRGFVEIDTNNFDTGIWNETQAVIVDTYDYIAPDKIIDVCSDLKASAFSSVANEIVMKPDGVVSGNAHLIVSPNGTGNDLRRSGVVVDQLESGALNPPIHNSSYWVIPADASTDVVTSNDLFDSFTRVSTGLGSNIRGIIGNENAIVVWGTSGVGRRSTDGGQTWSNTVGSIGGTHTQAHMTNTLWLIVTGGDDIWTSPDEGINWTKTNNVLIGNTVSIFSDDTYFYVRGNSNSAITNGITGSLLRSLDGITWEDTGLILDPVSPYQLPSFAVNETGYLNGIYYTQANDYEVWTSKDGLNFTPYKRNGEVEGNGVYAQVFESTNGMGIYTDQIKILDQLEDRLYAGDPEDWFTFTPESSYERQMTQFVRIT